MGRLASTINMSKGRASTILATRELLSRFNGAHRSILRSTVYRVRKSETKRVLLSTRVSHVNLVMASIASRKFLRITTYNNISHHALGNRRIAICNERPMFKIVTDAPPRLTDNSGRQGTARVSSVLVSVNTGGGRSTRGLISPKSETIIGSSFLSLYNSDISYKTLSSHSKVTILLHTLRLVGNGPRGGIAIIYSSHRRADNNKTGTTTFGSSTSRVVTISIDFTGAPSDGTRRYKVLNGNPVVNVSPSLSCRFNRRLIHITRGGSVPCRLRIVNNEANAGLSNVAARHNKVGDTLVSVPRGCVRAKVRIISIASVRLYTELVTTCVLKNSLGTWQTLWFGQRFQRKTHHGELCGFTFTIKHKVSRESTQRSRDLWGKRDQTRGWDCTQHTCKQNQLRGGLCGKKQMPRIRRNQQG